MKADIETINHCNSLLNEENYVLNLFDNLSIRPIKYLLPPNELITQQRQEEQYKLQVSLTEQFLSYRTKEFKYIFKGKTIFEIDPKLQFLLDYIKTKEYIADLQDNWDGENSTGCNPETWLASIRYLLDFAKKLLFEKNILIHQPIITRGPNYSIDIDWSQENYIFAINVAKDGEIAFLYASNKEGYECEWEFNPKNYDFALFPVALLKQNQK